MKKLINCFLPYYVHNNKLTNVTLKKKISFFFFYVDRYIFSPILHSLLRNKSVQEKNIIKKIYTKKIVDKLGLKKYYYSSKKSEDAENSVNKNQSFSSYNDPADIDKTGCKIVDKAFDKCNTDNITDKICGNVEINAMWPEQIFYVTPLEVKKQIENEKFNVIYIGHMTILIQTKNFNILIDPVLSNRIGLFNLFGVKRVIKPGISFENLPSIDFILLSSNRFDVMDKKTLKKIILRDNSIVIGGMNIRRYLFKKNFPVVYPLNWFNKLTFEDISFHYLPTLTNSSRYFIDNNIYLSGSFLIHQNTNNATIFYSGHSGYSKHFLQIKRYANAAIKNAEIDLSILPIGIYKPEYLYNGLHMSPKQALQAHIDLNSKKSLGIGNDVFCLGGEEYKEATIEIQNSLNFFEKKEIHFITLQPGQNIIF